MWTSAISNFTAMAGIQTPFTITLQLDSRFSYMGLPKCHLTIRLSILLHGAAKIFVVVILAQLCTYLSEPGNVSIERTRTYY